MRAAIRAALSQNPFFYKGPRYREIPRRPPDPERPITYVGRTPVPRRGGFKTDQSAYDYAYLFPEFENYKLPSREPLDERFVLTELCSFIREDSPELDQLFDYADKIIDPLTPKANRPSWFNSGYPRLDDVLHVIRQENRVKHPGFPGCLLGANKGTVIDRFLPDLVQAIFARLVCLHKSGPYCKSPEDFFELFCTDIISFSIKSEVVKVGKVGRGLCAVSMITTCVERLLYGCFDTAFKAGKFETYSMIGLGFTKDDSDLLHLTTPKKKARSDVPKFDSSVTLNENTRSAVTAMHRQGSFDDTPFKMAMQLERSLSEKIYILSNGWLYRQNKPGMQATGRSETSNFNTINRARRSYAVDLLLSSRGADIESAPKCAGDDCNETPHPDKYNTYVELGLPLRDYEIADDLVFCSHDWPEGETPIGQRIVKSAFTLFLDLPLDFERVFAFCREYSRHEDFPAFFERISVARPEMKFVLEKMVSFVFDDPEGTPQYEPCRRNRNKSTAIVIRAPQAPQQRKPRKRKPKRSTVPRSRAMLGAMAMAHRACALTNPFCPAAVGAKWPDNSYSKSVPFSITNNQNYIQTNSSGIGGALYSGGLYSYSVAATVTGSVINWTAFGLPYANPNVVRYRTNSWGLRLSCAGPLQTTQGYVRIRAYSPETYAMFAATDIRDIMADWSYDIPLVRLISKDFHIFPQPLGQQAHDYHVLEDSTIATGTNVGWQVISVGVDGALANSATVNVSYFGNFECVYADGTATQLFATPAPPDNPVLRTGSNNLLKDIGNFIEAGADKIDKIVQSKALKYFAGAAGAYMGGPQVGAAAFTIADGARDARGRYVQTVD